MFAVKTWLLPARESSASSSASGSGPGARGNGTNGPGPGSVTCQHSVSEAARDPYPELPQFPPVLSKHLIGHTKIELLAGWVQHQHPIESVIHRVNIVLNQQHGSVVALPQLPDPLIESCFAVRIKHRGWFVNHQKLRLHTQRGRER